MIPVIRQRNEAGCFAMSSSEKNIYLSLELFLDPAVTVPGQLEQELNRKIAEWNKLTNTSPKYKRFVETAKVCVTDENFNQLWLENQAKIAKNQRLVNLNNDIFVAEEDGVLEQVEYNAIVRKHKKFFREETIRQKFKLKVEPPFQPPQKPYDFSPPGDWEMNEMEEDLKAFRDGRYKNLYQLLDLARTTATGDLLKRTKELQAVNHNKPKGKAEVDAENRLLVKAAKFFANETTRKEYDLALRLRPFDELKEKFELRASKKNVTYDEYVKSIEETRELGFSEAEAQWHVYEFYCLKRKFPPPRRSVKVSDRWQCPLCFHLNDANDNFCRCGVPLKVRCQKCQRESTINDGVCKSCGFPINNMPNAVLLVEKARQKLAEKLIAEAEDFIRQANGYWRECPGIAQVRESLQELKKQQEAIRNQISGLEKQIKSALARCHIYEAHKLFLQIREIPNAVTSLEAEENRVRDTLAEIQILLKKLHSADDVADKMVICEDILTLAADCEEARNAYQQYPPSPPANLNADLVVLGVELNWESPPSRHPTAFVIVRKTGGTPVSKNDGKTLEQEFHGTQYLDRDIETGMIYGYAVFTRRDQAVETQGCRSGLVQKIDDVQNVNIIPGDGTMTFSWDAQHGCAETRVIRFDSLVSPSVGTPVPLQHPTSFIDTNLENGRVCHYFVQSVFKGIDGQPVLSPGKTFSAKPQVPPSAVVDLRAKRGQDNATLLTWTPPSRGELLLFDLSTAASLTIKPVEYTTIVDLKRRLGEPLTIANPVEGHTTWQSSSNGIRHITPVTFHDGIAVFGRRIRLTNISDITKLQMQMSGTNLYLTWEWPKDLDKVLILYRHDQFPQGINDPAAARRVFSRQEYDFQQGFLLREASTLSFYFSIHAMIADGEKTSCSPGVKLQTAKTVIRYDLVIRQRFYFFGKPVAKIMLVIESGESRFPDLVVQCNRGCPPLTREHGVPMMTIPARQGTAMSVPLDMTNIGENMYMKIFLKDPRESSSYLLEGPLQHKLKIRIP